MRLERAESHATYFSVGLPTGRLLFRAPSDLAWDVEMGGSATFAWRRSGRRSSFSGSYTPSYTRRAHYSQWNSLDHHLTLTAARRLGRRWDVSVAAAGYSNLLEQFLFAPPVFSRVLAVPATFEELAGAVAAGRFTNDQLASILTGAPVVESPARTLLFGSRVLGASAQTTLTYSPSARLSFHVRAGASRTQHLPDPQEDERVRGGYLLYRTSALNAQAGLSYSFSPRTHVGLEAAANRQSSPVLDAYTTTATGWVARNMGRRWFVQLRGGAGYIEPVRATFEQDRRPRYLAGASLGFKTRAHALLASHDRSVGDAYGLGSHRTDTTTGSWRWGRPGRTWWLYANTSRQRSYGSRWAELNGWLAGGGLARTVSRTTVLQTEYAYLSNTGRLTGSRPQASVHAVRLVLSWSPFLGPM
jgi:hypothetical protein